MANACPSMKNAGKQQVSTTVRDGIPSAIPTVPGWTTPGAHGVQQKLMRHAQISTTMNVYGNALMTAKREANSKVVRMALRSA